MYIRQVPLFFRAASMANIRSLCWYLNGGDDKYMIIARNSLEKRQKGRKDLYTCLWKRNISKAYRNQGNSYVNACGEMAPDRASQLRHLSLHFPNIDKYVLISLLHPYTQFTFVHIDNN